MRALRVLLGDPFSYASGDVSELSAENKEARRMTAEKKNLSKEERYEQAQDEFERKRQPLDDEHERKVKQLEDELERKTKPFWDEYRRTLEEIDAEDEDD